MSIIQICAAAVAGMLLAVQFKAQKPEYGIYISIALSLLIFFSVLEKIETIAEVIRKIGTYISVDDMYMGTLFKMLGIYLCGRICIEYLQRCGISDDCKTD